MNKKIINIVLVMITMMSLPVGIVHGETQYLNFEVIGQGEFFAYKNGEPMGYALPGKIINVPFEMGDQISFTAYPFKNNRLVSVCDEPYTECRADASGVYTVIGKLPVSMIASFEPFPEVVITPDPVRTPDPIPDPTPDPTPTPTPEPTTGIIHCVSNPTLAEVWLDGIYTGFRTEDSVYDLTNVSVGSHKVEFKKYINSVLNTCSVSDVIVVAGEYSNAECSLIPVPTPTPTPTPTPEPEVHVQPPRSSSGGGGGSTDSVSFSGGGSIDGITLFFNSTPAGATVLINRQKLGLTNTFRKGLPSGRYRIEYLMDGCANFSKDVNLDNGEEETIDVMMECTPPVQVVSMSGLPPAEPPEMETAIEPPLPPATATATNPLFIVLIMAGMVVAVVIARHFLIKPRVQSEDESEDEKPDTDLDSKVLGLKLSGQYTNKELVEIIGQDLTSLRSVERSISRLKKDKRL